MIRSSTYLEYTLSQIPRLLSMIDKSSHSLTYGCFDRDFWSWKFRDFPLIMLQASVYPMALLWKFPFENNPYFKNNQFFNWIWAGMQYALKMQHRNGSFDLTSPNEQDVGSTLGVMHGMTEAFRYLRDELDENKKHHFLDAVTKAFDFALYREEKHAIISNHLALFAVGFLNAYELTQNVNYLSRSEEIIDQIIHYQSSDGWYSEYYGPDPGYESLGIFHLAVYWKRTGLNHLLDSLKKSISFYTHFLQPNGGIGGDLGSRHTSLYFPAGFEILSDPIPEAAAVAKYMRQKLNNGNVALPSISDCENLPPLIYTFLEAALAENLQDDRKLPTLPVQNENFYKFFPDSGMLANSTRSYFSILNLKKGGICRIFDKSTKNIAHEDAGYLIRSGRTIYTSQFLRNENGSLTEAGREVHTVARFGKVKQELLSPLRLIFLRLMNLTLFHNKQLGDLVRRVIISRLITKRRFVPIFLERRILFQTDKILIRDSLKRDKSIRIDGIELVRSFMAIHMGSANYFHPSQLGEIPKYDLSHVAKKLNKEGHADHEIVLEFSS